MNIFNAGDLVQLKAGGPKMVIEVTVQQYGVVTSSTYRCTWFSGAKHNSHEFKEEALVVFKEDDK